MSKDEVMDWIALAKAALKHNREWLAACALFIFLTFSGTLPPEWRFATASEVGNVQTAMQEQTKKYTRIENALNEIRIGQVQDRLANMQRDADGRRANGQAVPDWLDQQIRETNRSLELMKAGVQSNGL